MTKERIPLEVKAAGLPQDVIDWIKTESVKAVPDMKDSVYGETRLIGKSWLEDIRDKWVDGAIAMWKRITILP